MQLGCNPPTMAIQKDDHQPRGGEKQAGLRPPSCPQLQGCSSSSLGRKASRARVLPPAWASSPLLPPAFGGRRGVHQPREGGEVRLHGRPGVGADSCRVPGSWPGWPCRRLRRCLLPFGRGMAVRPRTGDGRAVRGSATSTASPAPPAI
jgi:hypothetical protein